MTLSLDLRERVVAAIKNGMHKSKVAKVFNVSRRVIYNWLVLQKETNSLTPKSSCKKGHSSKIKDWTKFKIFVEANKHRTLKAMALEWEKLNNDTISRSAMWRSLKKINYTSKKKLLVIPKLMPKSAKNS